MLFFYNLNFKLWHLGKTTHTTDSFPEHLAVYEWSWNWIIGPGKDTRSSCTTQRLFINKRLIAPGNSRRKSTESFYPSGLERLNPVSSERKHAVVAVGVFGSRFRVQESDWPFFFDPYDRTGLPRSISLIKHHISSNHQYHTLCVSTGQQMASQDHAEVLHKCH